MPEGTVLFYSKTPRLSIVIRDYDSVAVKIGKSAKGIELLKQRQRVRFRERRDRHGQLEAYTIGKTK
jgi:hypothetical protein